MPSQTELERLRRRLQAGRLDLPQTGRLGLELPAATPIFPLIPRTSEAQELGPPATAAPRRTPIRDALRRAAIGFAAGVAATPQQAGQAPGLGAAVGALSGLGQVFERERERRRKSEERLLEPARAGRLETARQESQEPFRTERSELRQRQRLERDRLRADRVSSRDILRAQQVAAKSGMSVSEALRLLQEAKNEVSQNLDVGFPGSPAFELAVDLKFDQIVEKTRRVAAGKSPRTARTRGDDLGDQLFPPQK